MNLNISGSKIHIFIILFVFYVRSYAEDISREISTNHTDSNPKLLPSSREKEIPYTEISAFNLAKPRGGKNLNLTLLVKPADEVQSRIVNHPELYNDFPTNNFIYETTFVTSSPDVDEEKEWNYNSCICVPYYLCKNGFITSGGRIEVDENRQTRSLLYKIDNKTSPSYLTEEKVLNLYSQEQSKDCEKGYTCCYVMFDDDQEKYYPVATPTPDVYDTILPPLSQPNFPSNNRNRLSACGVRRVYGVQGRLQHLLYSPDVSEFGEYPWQAAVLKRVNSDRSLYLCGGVLISLNWIATVAHCIKKATSSQLLVRLGEWDVNRKDELYSYIEKDIDVIIPHPEYDPDTLINDIVLARLRNPIDSRLPHITPICFPRPDQSFIGQECWVSGWGKDFFGPQGEYQNVLKEVDVPIVSQEICQMKLQMTNLGPHFYLHPGFICAGGKAGKDACTGDGGSPLVCKQKEFWYVVGLVSWGIGCGQPGIPGVYVNILYYLDWINSIIW